MKRMPRKKLSKDKSIDLMKPIPLDKIGGEEDPCFGKHYDLTATECGRCGDSEICAIVSAQKMNIKRKQIEATTQFKDLQNLKPTRKQLSKALRIVLKKYPKGKPVTILKDKVVKKMGIHESDFDKLFPLVLKRNAKFKLKDNILKFKKV